MLSLRLGAVNVSKHVCCAYIAAGWLDLHAANRCIPPSRDPRPPAPARRSPVERLIGSIRREWLDHVVVLSEASPRRILQSYVAYYHDSRCHLALDMDSPETGEVQPPDTGIIVEIPRVGDLHHRYERCAA